MKLSGMPGALKILLRTSGSRFDGLGPPINFDSFKQDHRTRHGSSGTFCFTLCCWVDNIMKGGDIFCLSLAPSSLLHENSSAPGRTKSS